MSNSVLISSTKCVCGREPPSYWIGMDRISQTLLCVFQRTWNMCIYFSITLIYSLLYYEVILIMIKELSDSWICQLLKWEGIQRIPFSRLNMTSTEWIALLDLGLLGVSSSAELLLRWGYLIFNFVSLFALNFSSLVDER